MKEKKGLDRFPAACLTTWGAILGVVYDPKGHYYDPSFKHVCVADPDAIDAGQYISQDDIKLMWRISPAL